LKELQQQIVAAQQAAGNTEDALREKIVHELRWAQNQRRCNSVDPWATYWFYDGAPR
jgi:hypothetical protein